jgi:hypothetical protein
MFGIGNRSSGRRTPARGGVWSGGALRRAAVAGLGMLAYRWWRNRQAGPKPGMGGWPASGEMPGSVKGAGSVAGTSEAVGTGAGTGVVASGAGGTGSGQVW